MKKSSREVRLGAVLLGLTLVLWVTALLYLFRIDNFFQRVLMKFPGPVVIWGIMLFGPVVAAIRGVRMIQGGARSGLGRVFTIMGGLLIVAFIAVVGVPMLVNLFTPGTPKNSSTPRPVGPQVGLPVFPGAEGFGTRTVAGRGGKVIEVTSLANNGPGTLREALNDPDPRTIVFRVAGIIELDSEIYIPHPFVTVAGQTAPGSGITIKDGGLVITTHDVLIQHLRFRPGNEGPVEPDTNDAVAILGPHGDLEDSGYNIVLDHLSTSWSEDETVSVFYGAHDITISWSIISEALDRSRHRKETHSAGLLIGDGSYHVSVHHNLLAHNDFRNPLIAAGGTHDIVNNVIYDWGVLPSEIADYDANTFLNFVGNVFIPGPSTSLGPFEILFNEGDPRIYVEGNLGPHRPDASMDDWALVGFGYGEEGVAPETYRSFTRFATHEVTILSANEALEQVLAEAGASPRGLVDRRIVEEVLTGTGSIIDSPEEVGGYPETEVGLLPVDTDQDGLPNEWELEQGLDPDDPSDGATDLDGDGYTNLEAYLHFLSK